MTQNLSYKNMGRFLFLVFLVACHVVLCYSFTAHAEEKDIFLADRHIDRGLTCDSCHLETPPKDNVPSEICMDCHGDLQEVMALTEEVMPNPHDSHEELICANCHHGHKASENSCIQCHEFEYNVP